MPSYRKTIADLMEKRVGCVTYPFQWDFSQWRSSLEYILHADSVLCAEAACTSSREAAVQLLRTHGYNAYDWEIDHVRSIHGAAATTLDAAPSSSRRKSVFKRTVAAPPPI